MGTVYLAARDDGAFEQQVALKLVKRGMDTDEIVRRFVHERQILAALVHPHIARLLDGGTTERRPALLRHGAHRRRSRSPPSPTRAGLDVEARLGLFLEVAAAVQFAHQSLVVHRDLKPANILVGARRRAQAARLRHREATRRRRPRRPHPWTSLDGAAADARLREPGAARRPAGDHRDRRLRPRRSCSTSCWSARSSHGRPARARRRLGSPPAEPGGARRSAKARGKPERAAASPARARGAGSQGDLDTIVGKALAADPARRYGTAGRARRRPRAPPLAPAGASARRPTVAYRLGRTVLRHRLATPGLRASLIAATAAVTWQAFAQERRGGGRRRPPLPGGAVQGGGPGGEPR